MDSFTICSMTVANAGTTVSGSVERVDGGLVVVANGARLSSARRLKEAIHELAQQLRRRLPRSRSHDWGVSITCTSGGFTFGYGNLRAGGGGGSPATFTPCVQRMISTYPQPQAGLAAALEHAERALADCCT
jgi:hypothetical protein